MADTRPIWPREFVISEEVARWFCKHTVKRIEHKWRMTDVDEAEYWLVCTDTDGNTKEIGRPFAYLPTGLAFKSNYHGLIEVDKHIKAKVEEIDKWDKQHQKDLRELARLQRKLGVVIPRLEAGDREDA